ncbi:MAG: porphobilinogen synthase [Firmicutes bacterium]|jgi:porphobilinogen synthase|nr:porphobilinogen synthase [Bacillota bacterium]
MEAFTRHRRLRTGPRLRELVRETRIAPGQLIYPMFATAVGGVEEIASMPGIFHYPVDDLRREVVRLSQQGVDAILLFGIPSHKDDRCTQAYAEDGIVAQAVRAIKEENPDVLVLTDVCLCQYSPSGHCGIVREGQIVNDESLELIARTAVSHAQAGADVVAPSDMMDGRVAAIRAALDAAGYEHTAILSYAVKYASAFYGPFREAAHSAPAFGDRRTYQMDPANVREAVREARADLEQGADLLMVKPALAYLDVVKTIREMCAAPLVAYQVSGEYAMIKAAARMGWLDEREAVLESMTSIVRAGADAVITYFAPDLVRWLGEVQ